MPVLHWINDADARRAASQIPFHLLERKAVYGDPNQAQKNLIVHGDNLLALKALLPFYKGKVKCIYIDPPYNTGSAFEHYDDNLEHSQWLSLMLPRLQLLRDLMREDGVLFISIDDDEAHYLKVLCDEIFGRDNFCCSFIWEKKRKASYLSKLGVVTEYVLAYARNKSISPDFVLSADESKETYPLHNGGNPIKILTMPAGAVRFLQQETGLIRAQEFKAKTKTINLLDDIEIKNHTNVANFRIEGRWRYSQETIDEQVANGDLYIVKKKGQLNLRRQFSRVGESKKKVINLLSRAHFNMATNEDATAEGQELFGVEEAFDYPKPEMLVSKLIEMVTDKNELVLDAFLGSGTTAAVAHKMGRHYIGIEMGEHAVTHCVPRMQKVLDGEQGGISEAVNWNGGGGFTQPGSIAEFD